MASSKADKVDLKAYFDIRVVDGRGTPKAKCRTCEYDKALNPSRLRDHVNTCPGLQSQQQQGERTASPSRPGFTRQRSIRSYTQSTTASEKQRLDELAAEWIFHAGQPLSIFEDESFLRFLHALNPSYKPPSRKTITEDILPSLYSRLHDHLQHDVIDKAEYLNITHDASDDTALRRQLNISIVLPSGRSIFWRNIDTGSERHTAENLGAHIIREARAISRGNCSRINSFVSDTCSTARATTRMVLQDEDFKHCLQVDCDSHGLQLLFKDILKIPGLKGPFLDIIKSVTYFKTSALQYSRLRDKQVSLYGQRKALFTPYVAPPLLVSSQS
jgi:hypothetical protein